MQRYSKFFRVIFFVSIALVAYFSIISANKIPYIAALSFISDKLLHFIIFLSLSILGLFSNFKISNFIFLTLIFCFGLTIEVIHYHHPNRYFEIADLIANFVGILIASFIFKKKID